METERRLEVITGNQLGVRTDVKTEIQRGMGSENQLGTEFVVQLEFGTATACVAF